MSRKKDTIGYKEFNSLTNFSDKNHIQLPDEVLFDDENTVQNESTLMGMEYDNEDFEELQTEEDKEIARDRSRKEKLAENEMDLQADDEIEFDEGIKSQYMK